MRKAPDALMFKPGVLYADFRVVPCTKVEYYRWLGWFLLAREDEIRFADLDDTRQADEDRFKP